MVIVIVIVMVIVAVIVAVMLIDTVPARGGSTDK